MAHENVTFEPETGVVMTSFTTVHPNMTSFNNGDETNGKPYKERYLEEALGYENTEAIDENEMELANRRDEEVSIQSRNGKGSQDVAQVRVKDPPPTPPQWQLYMHIAFFAMCGCLCRIGTDKIFGSLAVIENSGEVVNLSFISNMVGSFVLGALNASPMGSTRLGAMYKGLTTGFCGSYTTWSKWNQQLSLALVGETNTVSQSQVLSIVSWFIGFHSFIGSYCVGLDFGKDVGGRIGKKVSPNGPKISNIAVAVLLFSAVAGFIVGVIVDPTQTGKSIWMAVLFAPFGACIRAYLAKYKYERFMLPLGTLLANLLGALVLAAIHVINVRAVTCGSGTICWGSVVTYGIGTGFCACLTTVSTFMSEIYKLRPANPKFAYGYAILTVVICQVLCGIINGINYNYDFY
ncbi:uncharacterized protein LOC100176892 isoform X1 [Ciona intestinalis]